MARALLAAGLTLPLLALACADPPPPEASPAALPVRSLVVEAAPFEPVLTLLGTVGPGSSAAVSAPVAGTIRYPARFARGLTTGATVRAGEVLAVIASLPAGERQGEAKIALRGAEEELARAERGFEVGILPKAERDRARVSADLARQRLADAGRALSQLAVRAPVAGRLVVAAPIPPGAEIAGGTPLATVAGGGRPRIEAQAAAGDLPHLRPGLAVRFLLPGGRAVGRGTLSEIAPMVDAAGTVRAIAEVDAGSENAELPPPGSGIEVEVALERRPAAITLPEEALVVTAEGTAVYRLYRLQNVEDRQAARRQPVTAGGRRDGRVEIVEGLAAGDRVAVAGVAALSNGALVVEEAGTPPPKTGARP